MSADNMSPMERRQLREDIAFVRAELGARCAGRVQIREASGRILGPVVTLQEARPTIVATTPRPACPYPRLETTLRLIESRVWREYMPADARLELRWETGNRSLSGLTYYDRTKQAHVVRLKVRPDLPMRRLLETALHEVAHAVLDHCGRTHVWTGTPEDQLSMDQISAARAALLERLETELREAGRAPSPPPARDRESEAEDWMKRELPRWVYD